MKLAKMSEERLEYFRRKARGTSQRAHFYAHMLECYRTMFDNACDPNSDVIDWKPEIKAAIDTHEFLVRELEDVENTFDLSHDFIEKLRNYL